MHELIICEYELLRNDYEVKKPRWVNTRKICPSVGQVSIQIIRRKRNAEEDVLQFFRK